MLYFCIVKNIKFMLSKKKIEDFRAWSKNNAHYLNISKPSRSKLLKRLNKEGFHLNESELAFLIKEVKPFSQKNKIHTIDEVTVTGQSLVTKDFTPRKAWYNGKEWCASLENMATPDFEKLTKDIIEELSSLNKNPFKPVELSNKTLLVFSLPDLHVGKVPFEDIKENVMTAVSSLFDRYDFKRHSYHVLFVMGNDVLNTDFDYKTTKGTSQFDVSEWHKSFVDAVNIIKSVVDYISSLTSIEIINVPGNHDRQRGFYLGTVMEAYYNGLVDNKINPRKYYKFGSTLIGFDHGELKATEYPLLMVTEAPLEYSQTSFQEWFLGHLHSEQVIEHKGFKMRYLPSLTNHKDEWHIRQGYVNNKRSAWIYEYDYEQGLIGTKVFNIK